MKIRTETDLANLALSMIGESEISSIEEVDSKVAAKCRRFLGQSIDEVLREHRWSCAIKRTTLNQDAETPAFGWPFAYILPEECLRLLELNSEPVGDNVTDTVIIESGRLLTDVSFAEVRYIYRPEIHKMDAILHEALAAKLASFLAVSLTGNVQLKQLSDGEYEKAVGKASRINAIEAIKVASSYEIFQSRFGRGGSSRMSRSRSAVPATPSESTNTGALLQVANLSDLTDKAAARLALGCVALVEFTGLSTTVGQHALRLDALEVSLGTLPTQVVTLTSRVEAAESAADTASAAVAGIGSSVTALGIAVSGALADVDSMEASVAALALADSAEATARSDADSLLSAADVALDARVTTAEATISTNTSAIAARLVAANNLSDVSNAATARANIGAFASASVVSTNTPGTAVLRGAAGAIVVGTIASSSITVTGSITTSSGITAFGFASTTGHSTFGTGTLTIGASVTNINAGALIVTLATGVVSLGQGALQVNGTTGVITLAAGTGTLINGNVVFGAGSSLLFASPVAAATLTSLTAAVTVDNPNTAITLTDADSGKIIRCTSSTAVAITVPAGLAIGFHITIIQGAAGQITFSGAGLKSFGSFLKTAGLYARASIIRVAADTYNLGGNLVA